MQQAAPSIEELFFAALELEGSEARSAFLDGHCGNTELRQRVQELLDGDARGSDFLRTPASMPAVTAAYDSRSGIEVSGTTIGPYKLLEAIGALRPGVPDSCHGPDTGHPSAHGAPVRTRGTRPDEATRRDTR